MIRAAILLCCVYFVTFPTYSVQALTEEQKNMIHEHFIKIGMECMKDTPIGEDDINNLRNNKPPTGENGPCFLACVMKSIGVMDDAGMLQKETALDLARKIFDNDEEIKNIGDYLHSCAHVNQVSVSDGAKGCDRAIAGFKCMTENASKFGFEL